MKTYSFINSRFFVLLAFTFISMIFIGQYSLAEGGSPPPRPSTEAPKKDVKPMPFTELKCKSMSDAEKKKYTIPNIIDAAKKAKKSGEKISVDVFLNLIFERAGCARKMIPLQVFDVTGDVVSKFTGMDKTTQERHEDIAVTISTFRKARKTASIDLLDAAISKIYDFFEKATPGIFSKEDIKNFPAAD